MRTAGWAVPHSPSISPSSAWRRRSSSTPSASQKNKIGNDCPKKERNMYVPAHFSEDDAEKLARLIEENSFGMLVTVAEGRPFASHIPFLYESDKKVLRGHVARANPQWRHFSVNTEVMVVFQGPHGYISPSWYRAPGVPTWNYAVAHVYGRARALEEADAIKPIVEALTQKNESHKAR